MSSPAGGQDSSQVSGRMTGGRAALVEAEHRGGASTDQPLVLPSTTVVRPALTVNQSRSSGSAQSPASSETFRWVRRAVAVAAPILAVNSIFTAFADDMPASHHIAALIAAPIFVAAWMIEVAGIRWPRLALVAAIIIPNLVLTLIGHTETNYLFLALLVGWVAFTGNRLEGLIAVALALAIISLGVILYAAPAIGGIPWEFWTEWTFTLVLTWFMGLSLRRQERLVIELDQRSQELTTLLAVSGSVASTIEMRQLLETVFDALGTVLDYSAIAVLILNESRDTLTVAARRGPTFYAWQDPTRMRYAVSDLGTVWDRLSREEPIVIPDVRAGSSEAQIFRGVLGDQLLEASDTFVRSFMWVPLVVRGQIIGLLTITNPSSGVFGAREATLALGVARQAAVAIENARLHDRARQAAVLEERQRLARELHDSVTQALYGISLYAEAAGRALAEGQTEPVATNLREVREATQEALGEMRLLIYELRPPLLEEYGLAAALRARLKAVETRAGLVTDFLSDGEDRLSPDKEQELYRLAQEALNNVLKHAHAQRVGVRLATSSDRITLEVADDGVGFEPSLQGAGGFGLPGMRERAERLGGMLHIESAPAEGTRLRIEVPR